MRKALIKPTVWLGLFFIVLAWSAIKPRDYFTWFLEVTPALLGLFALAITRRSFPLTPLLYVLILIHSIILMIGGHYTYAEVPLFDWIRDWAHSSRNNYDKVGHFAQGFVPFLICREIIIRKSIIKGYVWQIFFCVCFCLALSAAYELLEWQVSIASGENADAFLGTQGDIWDTQSDMAMALIGAISAWISLVWLQDKELKNLKR